MHLHCDCASDAINCVCKGVNQMAHIYTHMAHKKLMNVNDKETTLLRVDCNVDQSPLGGPNSFQLYVALLSSYTNFGLRLLNDVTLTSLPKNCYTINLQYIFLPTQTLVKLWYFMY